MSIEKQLSKPAIYKEQIYALNQQKQFRRIDTENDIDINSISLHQNKIARLLANLVKKKKYEPQPVQERVIYVEDKARVICKLSDIDHIVQSAICRSIMPELGNFLSKQLYSYKHRSNYTAAQQFAEYIRKKRKNKRLDLLVIRTDVKSYTDSIPVDEHSILWNKLKQLFEYLKIEGENKNYLLSLIKTFLRPVIIMEDGISYQRMRGLPMGAPLSAIVALIYLNTLDHELKDQPDTFYARYGDDILIAHPNHEVILSLNKKLKKRLRELSLSTNLKKHQIIYLTCSGSPFQSNADFIPSQKVSYLGYNINAYGTIGLKRKSQRKLLADIFKRINNLAKLFKALPMKEKAHHICQSINQSININQPLGSEKLEILLDNITDRQQLKQLDFLIALKIAETITGIYGVKAFRQLPYKVIRKQSGLHSLCQLRNRRYKLWKS